MKKIISIATHQRKDSFQMETQKKDNDFRNQTIYLAWRNGKPEFTKVII